MAGRSAGVVTALLLAVFGLHIAAPRTVVRGFGTADGLSHEHVRDIMQDSRGYMWFATWTGVDRFDGYEFRHFRTYPGDEVRLDNNRIERLAESPDGKILVQTYTHRIYALDPSTGCFSRVGAADSARFEHLRAAGRRRAVLPADYTPASSLYCADADGNLWVARKGGVDYVAQASDAFRFVDTQAIDTLGEDIHALYAAPDGKLWAASRDSRVMLYDARGDYLGNLSPDGRVLRNPALGTGVRPYSFIADSLGRVWIGTKSQRLWVLAPRSTGDYDISEYRQSATPGGLAVADIYGFASDSRGRIWLATFGAGVAEAFIAADGSLSFRFHDDAPAVIARSRRLLAVADTVMAVAATKGIGAFNPDSAYPAIHCIGADAESPLGNEDILDICRAADGKIYFAAFSGGIDYVDSASVLMAPDPAVHNISIRSGLDAEPVLSVIQTPDGDFWVAASTAISRYDSDWHLKATYDAGNLGRTVRPTEARPQIMPDGRLVFGLSGGLLFIDPQAITVSHVPGFEVTALEYDGTSFSGLGADNAVVLPVGVRDLAVRFASLDYGGARNVRYAYSFGDDAPWIALGRERTVRLSGMPAGSHLLRLRRTDAFGSWLPDELHVVVEVPRTWREVLGEILVWLAVAVALSGAVWGVCRVYAWRRRRALLEHCIACVLDAVPLSDSATFMERVCAFIALHYGDPAMKAEQIASAIGIGRNDLRREVKGALGISLEDFIRIVRVRAAARLLHKGGSMVAEVAYACGFSTPQYMAMVFKDIMGCTPGEYAGRR